MQIFKDAPCSFVVVETYPICTEDTTASNAIQMKIIYCLLRLFTTGISNAIKVKS